jgi:hypothetical protein
MCSAEEINGQWIDTCPNSARKAKTPSELNLAGVTKLYGVDGFRNPNDSVTYGQLFAINNPAIVNIPKTSPSPDLSKDSDNDGIPDYEDFCSNDKETWNGYQDKDGCSDTKPQSVPSESPIKEKDQESEDTRTLTKCGSGTILKNGVCVLDESVTSDTLERQDMSETNNLESRESNNQDFISQLFNMIRSWFGL